MVWEYFQYDSMQGKNVCQIEKLNTESLCEKSIAGKNPTNLQQHIKSTHPRAAGKLQETDRGTSKCIICTWWWTLHRDLCHIFPFYRQYNLTAQRLPRELEERIDVHMRYTWELRLETDMPNKQVAQDECTLKVITAICVLSQLLGEHGWDTCLLWHGPWQDNCCKGEDHQGQNNRIAEEAHHCCLWCFWPL